MHFQEAFDSNFPRWEDIETMRFQIEEELIEKHERKMQQRRYYDQRLMLVGARLLWRKPSDSELEMHGFSLGF